MVDSTADANLPESVSPTPLDIFIAFSGIAIVGFGGVLPWARRMLVEKRRWMSAAEFTEALSVAQFLPGGNILNLSVAVGQRFHGPLGSLAAITGLLLGPMVIVSLLGLLYLHAGDIPAVKDALGGVAAGAAGLIISMAAKLARPLFVRGSLVGLGFVVAAFIGIIVLKMPLLAVVAVLAPLSIAYAWWRLP
jgi:chromate transporter